MLQCDGLYFESMPLGVVVFKGNKKAFCSNLSNNTAGLNAVSLKIKGS